MIEKSKKTGRFCCRAIVVLVLSLCCVVCAYSEDVRFEITADRNSVSAGDTLELDMIFYNTQGVSAPTPPKVDGFQVNYVGPATKMSIVNGRVSSSITHVYNLLAIKEGRFQIGPFSMTINNQSYTSNAITVDVYAGSVPRGQGLAESQSIPSRDDLKDRLFLVMETDKKNAYVNEEIPLKIRLYVNGLALRDVEYPEFAHEGFSIGELSKPRQEPKVFKGMMYEMLEFETKIFGTRAGTFKLGPARVKGNIVMQKARRGPRSFYDDAFNDDMFDNFFGRFETYPLNLVSDPLELNILPLPESDKPKDFKGALGNYNFEVIVNPSRVKLGDPITLSYMVSGDGNLNTVSVPELRTDANFKVYEPQVVKQRDGLKVFEQIIIPMKLEAVNIPAVNFSFFDPHKGKYQTVQKGPFAIEVTKPDKEEQSKIIEVPAGGIEPVSKEVLGRDIIYIKNDPGIILKPGEYIYRSPIYVMLNVLPLIALMFAFFSKIHNQRMSRDIRYAHKVTASRKVREGLKKINARMSKNDAARFYDAVFKTMQWYLGGKFHMPAAGITKEIVDARLKSHGVSPEIQEKIKMIFDECDIARYAPYQMSSENIKDTYDKVKETMEYLEKVKV